MINKIISDNHTHTSFSLDSECPIEQMFATACNLGIKYYTVTDHCEANEYISAGYNQIVRNSNKAIKKLQKENPNAKTKLLAGVELGEPLENLEYANDILTCCDYDFVIGSIHNLPNMPDFYFADYSKIDIHQCLIEYFDEVLKTIEWGKFDTLAHLTYPLRYICGEHGIPVDITLYFDKIDAIFKALIEKEISLEINTSGFRQKIGVSMPDLQLLKRYKALGGKMITIGSDAHKAEDVGKGILQGYKTLKEAGFNEFVVYINREPHFFAIPE